MVFSARQLTRGIMVVRALPKPLLWLFYLVVGAASAARMAAALEKPQGIHVGGSSVGMDDGGSNKGGMEALRVGSGDVSGAQLEAGEGRVPVSGAPEEEMDSEGEWMVRWADEEGQPLRQFRTTTDSDVPLPLDRTHVGEPPPPRGILVGAAPGPQSIDWGMLFNIWDYDENPWTPTRNSLIGPLSNFQVMKRAFPPKLVYGVVLLALLVAALLRPITAAKNAKIAAKRRHVAEAKAEVARVAEQTAVARQENAKEIIDNAALAATLSVQRECLASLTDLRGAVYPSAERARKPKSNFGPDWGLYEFPTEIRLRMLQEWGDLPAFLNIELGRLIRTLEVQQKALDAKKNQSLQFEDGITPVRPSDIMPITDSPEECRRFLESSRVISSVFKSTKKGEFTSYSIKRARQLILYGLLLQRQQELRLNATQFQQEAEQLERQDRNVESLLRQKWRELERVIVKYVRVAREILDVQAENTALPAVAAEQFEKFVQSINLQDISAFADKLHHLEDTDAAEKLSRPTAEILGYISSSLPQMVACEASLLPNLSHLQAVGSPEEQQAAESMSAACERIGMERDQMVGRLSTLLGEVSLIAVQKARRLEKIKKAKDAATNALEAIDGMQPLLTKARNGAIQGVI